MLERVSSKISRRRTADPDVVQREPSGGELVSQKERIVVFGSRLSGAYNAAAEFQDYLGSIDPRYAAIEVGAVRQTSLIDPVINGESPDGSKTSALPVGVVVFPEMRTEHGGYSYTVPTPVSYISGLCEERGIPYIVVSADAATPELTFPGAEALAEGAVVANEK